MAGCRARGAGQDGQGAGVILRFQSDSRGYMVELSEDLFGAYVLRRRWYGLNNRRGGAKQQVFLNMSDALKEVRRITRTRERHGYRRG